MNDTVEERLRHLEDMEQIRALLVSYGRALDERDLKGYSELFATDGEWRGGIGAARTPDGIRAMLEAALGAGSEAKFPGAFHVMSNMLISVDGNRASARSRWTWFIRNPDGAPCAARAGYYEDELVREAGCWRFKRRLAVTESQARAP